MGNAFKWVFYLAASAIGLAAFLAVAAFMATAGLVVGGLALIALVVWLIAAALKAGVETPKLPDK